MDAHSNIAARETFKYPNLWIRLFMSVAASHFIILQGRFERYSVIASGTFFLIGFVSSIIISFLIINYVHFVSKFLDKTYPWELVFFQRLFLQLFYGVILAVLMNYALISIYYDAVRGLAPWESGWFERYSVPVTLMLNILNSIYAIWYLVVKLNALKKPSSSNNRTVSNTDNAWANLFLEQQERHSIQTTPKDSLVNSKAFVPLANNESLVTTGVLQLVHLVNGLRIVYDKASSGTSVKTLQQIWENLDKREYEYCPKNCIVKNSNILDVRASGLGYDLELEHPRMTLYISQTQGERMKKYSKIS